MRYKIDKKLIEDVNITKIGFRLNNQGRCNTYSLLSLYKKCEKEIKVVKSLPEKVLTLVNMTLENPTIQKAFNTYCIKGNIHNENKIYSDFVCFVGDKLSINSSYRLNDSFYTSDQYYFAKILVKIINNALDYLDKTDEYGYMIRQVFNVKFCKVYQDNECMLCDLKSRLYHSDDIKDVTFHKYLKYTIMRIDEYIFSEKNPYLHYLNGYVFEKCTKTNRRIYKNEKDERNYS